MLFKIKNDQKIEPYLLQLTKILILHLTHIIRKHKFHFALESQENLIWKTKHHTKYLVHTSRKIVRKIYKILIIRKRFSLNFIVCLSFRTKFNALKRSMCF